MSAETCTFVLIIKVISHLSQEKQSIVCREHGEKMDSIWLIALYDPLKALQTKVNVGTQWKIISAHRHGCNQRKGFLHPFVIRSEFYLTQESSSSQEPWVRGRFCHSECAKCYRTFCHSRESRSFGQWTKDFYADELKKNCDYRTLIWLDGNCPTVVQQTL